MNVLKILAVAGAKMVAVLVLDSATMAALVVLTKSQTIPMHFSIRNVAAIRIGTLVIVHCANAMAMVAVSRALQFVWLVRTSLMARIANAVSTAFSVVPSTEELVRPVHATAKQIIVTTKQEDVIARPRV